MVKKISKILQLGIPMAVAMALIAPGKSIAGTVSLPKTGVTTSYNTGDDGDLQKGASWPDPRFTDNSDGTVTDNLTGLIWLKDFDCLGTGTVSQATAAANALEDGSCNLSDDSQAGDWRLPNINELKSVLVYEYYNPPLSDTDGTGQWSNGDPFTDFPCMGGWIITSDIYVDETRFFHVWPYDGQWAPLTTTIGHIWAVRGTSSTIPKTGVTTSYYTGDDGDLEKGVAWPNPRFTDNSDGTVTDNLTGLVWLENADCIGQKSLTDALSACNAMADGTCNLSDNSQAGDWRLPNVNELTSLLDLEYDYPALPNTAGTGQWSDGDPFSGNLDWYTNGFWTSTRKPTTSGYFYWSVDTRVGMVSSSGSSVWCVR